MRSANVHVLYPENVSEKTFLHCKTGTTFVTKVKWSRIEIIGLFVYLYRIESKSDSIHEKLEIIKMLIATDDSRSLRVKGYLNYIKAVWNELSPEQDGDLLEENREINLNKYITKILYHI
jgi:hypothetical protein